MAPGECASGSPPSTVFPFPLPHFLQGSPILFLLSPYSVTFPQRWGSVVPWFPWSFPGSPLLPEVGKKAM